MGTVNQYKGALGSPGPFSVLFSESAVLLFGPPIANVAISKTWQSACREKGLVSVTEWTDGETDKHEGMWHSPGPKESKT